MNIKVGDIFYSSGGITNFYQVVKVYDNGRIRIRKIKKVEEPTDCRYEFLAKPLKNKFCPKKEYDESDKRYIDIMDNEKGTVKTIQYFSDNEPYINLKCNKWANLYKGDSVISSYWSVWMR